MEEPSGASERVLRGGVNARVEGLIKQIAGKNRRCTKEDEKLGGASTNELGERRGELL